MLEALAGRSGPVSNGTHPAGTLPIAGLLFVVKDATRKSPVEVPAGLVSVTLGVAVACAVDDEDSYCTVPVVGAAVVTVIVWLVESDPPELVTLSVTV
jgi:hypothetical protein